GQGIMGFYEGKKFFIGNERLMKEHGLAVSAKVRAWLDQASAQAHTVVMFADESQVLCAIAIADRIKPSSITAIRELQQQGIKVYMLTGDNEQAARAVAEAISIR